MSPILQPTSNLLLDKLSITEQRRMFPLLELVVLCSGTALNEPYERLNHAYFPVDSIVSVFSETIDGGTAECNLVGSDGMYGTTLLLGGFSTYRRAIVQRGGYAYRLPAPELLEEFNRYGNMHELLLRYIQAAFTQASQMAVCNRHHNVKQQLCRWLLLYVDRAHDNRASVTHQRIADMLGVRREGVSMAASRLQRMGAISSRRGIITVTNRDKLEALSCECYAVVKLEFDRLTEYDVKTVRSA